MRVVGMGFVTLGFLLSTVQQARATNITISYKGPWEATPGAIVEMAQGGVVADWELTVFTPDPSVSFRLIFPHALNATFFLPEPFTLSSFVLEGTENTGLTREEVTLDIFHTQPGVVLSEGLSYDVFGDVESFTPDFEVGVGRSAILIVYEHPQGGVTTFTMLGLVPEPATAVLVAFGLAAVGLRRRQFSAGSTSRTSL